MGKKYSKALTSIEIILLVALISILTLILAVAFNPGQRLQEAQFAAELVQLRQVAESFRFYIADNNGALPLRDNGNPSRVQPIAWINTNMIDPNDCGPGLRLSNYDDALADTYIPQDLFDSLEANYQVVFTPDSQVFVCRDNTNPLVYIFL